MVAMNEPEVIHLTNGNVLMGKRTTGGALGANALTGVETVTFADVVKMVELQPKNKEEIGQVAMLPYMPYSNAQEVVDVALNQIVAVATPQPEIAERYKQAFQQQPEQQSQSGLITPQNSSLIT